MMDVFIGAITLVFLSFAGGVIVGMGLADSMWKKTVERIPTRNNSL